MRAKSSELNVLEKFISCDFAISHDCAGCKKWIKCVKMSTLKNYLTNYSVNNKNIHVKNKTVIK